MGLDIVEMVLAVEREFGIDLPDAELAPVRTVGEFEALVAHRAGAVGAEARRQLHARLIDIIVRETGAAPERLVPEAHFHRDLGIG
ncbi:MAG TPA: hypothetical protein VGD77_01620 [Gemmatimonadaceae bacterium]